MLIKTLNLAVVRKLSLDDIPQLSENLYSYPTEDKVPVQLRS